MSRLAIYLLGAPSVEVDGQILEIPRRKLWALLAYLCLHTAPLQRDTLAALLWPDADQARARLSLSRHLSELKEVLGDGWLSIDHERISLPRSPDFWLDVDELRRLSAAPASGRADLAALTATATLYRNDFLSGFTLSDSPEFDEWQSLQSEELRRMLAALLEALVHGHLEQDRAEAALPFAQRWLALDSYHEQAHRQLMRLYALSGQRSAAIRQYRLCAQLLDAEFQMTPSAETTDLYREIVQGRFPAGGSGALPMESKAPLAPHPNLSPPPTAFAGGEDELIDLEGWLANPDAYYPGKSSSTDSVSAQLVSAEAVTSTPNLPQSPYHPQSNVPEHGRIYGRQHDLERLTQWLTQDRCRLIALLGMGGIGKTTLAAVAVRAVASQFDIVLWRSLVNAPPLDEILLDWLKILSGDGVAPLPESLDAQIAHLLDCLRQRRCLLVLDNLESIFQAGQAGVMRPGHQGYAQLIRRLGELQHQSCLLLTSREDSRAFAQLEDDLHHVRSLQLEGLDVAAAESMLQDRGLVKHSTGAISLVTRYSGNPLALKLVAETVLELFGGNIESFLATEAIIFEDIRAVLDWQFERLSALEQEILLWLAVEREPLSLQGLRANLTPPRPAVEVLAALRGLRRCSLLEQAPDISATLSARGAERMGEKSGSFPVGAGQTEIRFVLQNVLTEYLTARLLEIAYQEIQQEKLVDLHSHALIKAQANEYVRQSQVRLILHPLAERLQATVGKEETIHKIRRILAGLRAEPSMAKGYGAGNLLNLLLNLDVDLTGYDFSRLRVRQADLRHANLPAVNFAGADLAQSCFAEGFGYIFAVAYSPDGALLAAGSSSGELRLWQASDGRLLHIYQGHKGAVKSVAFSPNGALLASGGDDETVRLWSVMGNALGSTFPDVSATFLAIGAETSETYESTSNEAPFVRVLQGHQRRVTAVAFHPDGKTLASGGVDQTVRLWDVATGAMTALLHGHEHWVWTIAFHPSGALLASAGYDHSVRLWDLQTASARALLTGHTDIVSGVAFEGSGARLASSSFDGTVRLWDVASGQLLQTLAVLPDEINAIAISPNGDFLAYGGDDNAAHICDLRSGSLRHLLTGHDSDILTLAFSPDGQTLASGSSDQTVRLWDAQTGRLRQTIIGYSQSIRTLAYHPNGKLVASAHYDHVVRLWDMESCTSDPNVSAIAAEQSGKLDQVLHGHTKAVQTVTLSADGAWLASGGDDQTILLWRLYDPNFSAMGAEKLGKVNQGRAQHRHILYSQHGRVTALAFSPDGVTLVSGGESVCLWDVESGRLRRLLPEHDSPVAGAQFSPDGSLLAIVSRSQTIRLWDAHNDTLLHLWHGHEAFIYTVAFTPDGQTLATAGGDGVVCLWDVRVPSQPVLRATLHGHTDRVFAIAFSADGRRMVSSSADRTVALWDMQSGQMIRKMVGHTRLVWAVGISPDGKHAASGGPDETLRLWDTENGVCLAILTGSGPYDGMNISGVTGISQAQKTTLLRLGAVEQ